MPIALSCDRGTGFLPAATAHQVAGLYADSPQLRQAGLFAGRLQPRVQADWTFCLQVLSSPAALAMNFLKKF
jgi:hypothetical protein